MTDVPLPMLAFPAGPDRRPARHVREACVQYASAVGLIVAAHVLSVFCWTTLGPATHTIFLAAVVLSALYGGYGPGLLATVLAGADLAYTFIPPYHSFAVDLHEAVFLVSFMAVALLTSALQARRRSAEATLRREHDELMRDLLDISEREQQRIGHDLHDGLGQELTGISMLSVALADQLRGQQSSAGPHADEVAALVQRSIRHTRELARGLCPVDLEGDGLAPALARLADLVSRLPNVRCTFDGVGHAAVDAATGVHLYRIAQEAINNALRHGRAKTAHVTLTAVDGRLTLTVADDGRGFTPDPASTGMGLRLMHYRARTVHATLELRPRPEGGTTVVCALDDSASNLGAEHG